MNTLVVDSKTQMIAPPTVGLEAAVGNTPLLPLHRLARLSPGVQVYAKAEWFNPGGSVKDRPALNILRMALAEERLSAGRRLLDSTSGNMGIAYATFGAALGIPVTLAIPGNASPERFVTAYDLGAIAKAAMKNPISKEIVKIARRMAAE